MSLLILQQISTFLRDLMKIHFSKQFLQTLLLIYNSACGHSGMHTNWIPIKSNLRISIINWKYLWLIRKDFKERFNYHKRKWMRINSAIPLSKFSTLLAYCHIFSTLHFIMVTLNSISEDKEKWKQQDRISCQQK